MTAGPARIEGNNLFLTTAGVGTVTVAASQDGNANFLAATPVSRTFTVSRATQKLTWSTLPSVTFGDAPFTVTVTSSSGLPVTLGAGSATVSVSGSTVTILGAGNALLTAAQVGNALYDGITDSKSFSIAQATQTITFASLPDTAWKTTAIPLVASSRGD